jgi:hypothetical protein
LSRQILVLLPMLLVRCGGDSVAGDAGPDVTTTDSGSDAPANGDAAVDAKAEADAAPLAPGALAGVLVLPDTTGAGMALDFASNGDALFGGTLGDSSGNVVINGSSFASIGGNDVLAIKLAAKGTFAWAKSFGGGSDDYTYASVMDAAGDAYIAGEVYCQTPTQVIPFGAMSLTCKHIGAATFVAKLKSADGSTMWVETFDGASGFGQSCNTLAVNPASGFVAVGCDVRGDMTFVDTSNTTHTVPHLNSTLDDIFLAELDPTTGHVAKSAYIAGANVDTASKLVYDAAGDLHVVGSFKATSMSAYIPATSTTAAFTFSRVGPTQDGFVLKLGPSWSLLWDHVYTDQTSSTIDGAAIDGAGDIYFTGTFFATEDFGIGGMTAAGSADVAIVKLSAAGTTLAQTRIGGTNVIMSAPRIAVDGAGTVVVSGQYQAQAAGIQIGTTQLASSNGDAFASFTAKLSSDLKTVIWAEGNACPTASTSSTGLRIDDVAIDPSSQQVGVVGDLVNATTDFGDGTQVSRTVDGLFFLRRAP